jgi:hypothetical protein
MELAIVNSTAYCPPECQSGSDFLVRWLSGRKQRFAKAPYLSKGTEGSNPSLTAPALRRVSEIYKRTHFRITSGSVIPPSPRSRQFNRIYRGSC